MDKKIIINGIFYVILTSFFLFIWIREKQLGIKIKEYRNTFSTSLIKVLGIKNPNSQKGLRKTVDVVETLGTAIILVLIIQRFYLGNFLVPTGSMIPTIEKRDRLFGNMVIYKFTTPKREDIVVFKEPREDKVLYTKRLMGLPGEIIQIKADKRLYVNGKKISDREYLQLFDDSRMKENKWRIPKKGDILEISPKENMKKELSIRHIDVGDFQKKMSQSPDEVERDDPNFAIKFIVNGKETGPIYDFLHDKEVVKKLVNGETIKVKLKEDYYFCLGDNTKFSYDSRFWGFVKESRFRGRPFFRFWPLNRMGFLK